MKTELEQSKMPSEENRRIAILKSATTAGTLDEIAKRSGVSRSACHRWLLKLHEQGLFDRQEQLYVTSEAGLKAIDGVDFSHFPPPALSRVWPQIELMPTRLHAAALVISILAIAVRKTEIVEDLHVSIILAGATQRLKSFVVKALCALLRVDPKTIEMKMMQVRPRGMLERKDARGQTVYESEVMKMPFVWMNECSRMDKAAQRDLETLLHGSKTIKIENNVFRAEATPILETNYKKPSGTLAERLGFDEPIIRRAAVADFTNCVVTKDMRVDSPELLEQLQRGPSIPLPCPANEKIPREQRLVIETAVERAVRKDCVDSIDVARIATLVRGLQGVLSWEQATQVVIYYFFLMNDSTEFLVVNWRSILAVLFIPRAIPQAIQSQPQPVGSSASAVPPAMVPSPLQKTDARTTQIHLGTTRAAPDWSKNPFDGQESVLRVKAALHDAGLSPDRDGKLLLAGLQAIQRFIALHRTADGVSGDSIVKFINDWPHYKKIYDIVKKQALTEQEEERLIQSVSALCLELGDAQEIDPWIDLIQKARTVNMGPEDIKYELWGPDRPDHLR